MRGLRAWVLAAVVLPLSAGAVSAQQPAPDTATITMEKARATALAQVPDNQGVKSVKLKTKDGVLVYEFDIQTPGPGHREVRIDAHTGTVVKDKMEGGVAGAAANTASDAGQAVAGAAKEVGKTVAGAAADAANAVDEVLTGDDLIKANPTITEARANAIAQGAYANATVTKTELNRHSGALVWKIDLTRTGMAGHDEVRVDATTGKILEQKHED